LLESLLADAPPEAGTTVAVLLNGLGSTKYEELFVLYKDINRRLLAEGLTPYTPIVNEMVTSLDMAGCSLTLCWLDAELTELLDAPCTSAAYTNS
jgi:dihydroxyacetone kinase